MATWDLWERLEKVVQNDSFMSANEDFQTLKTAVLKQGDALPAQRQYATLAWEFLLGFAQKKSFYRSHVCQVVAALLADSDFRNAYASNPALQKKASELHADVQKALEAVDAVEAKPPQKPEPTARPKSSSGKEVTWPDWDAIEAAVRMDHFMGSNEEFRLLRLAVLAADPGQLADQVARAPLVWQFLAGFGEKKALYRSQMAEVIGILRQEKRWEESLDAVRSKLQDRVQSLPSFLQKALGADHAEAEEASNAASFSQENLEVDSPKEEEMQNYSSPSFESLEERLKSMMGYMESLAGSQESPEAAGPSAAPAVPAPAPAAVPVAPAAEDARVQEMEKLLKATENVQPAAPPEQPAKPDIPAAYAGPFEKAAALLERVKTLEGQSPVVGYYVQVYALELLITAKQAGQSNPEADQMMLASLQTAELKKGQLNLTGGPAKTQEFVLQIYEAAAASDSLQELLDASLYLETLSQFYGTTPPVELTNRMSYAQLRSDYLTGCLETGRVPAPAKPPLLPVPVLPGAPAAQTPAAAPAAPAATPAPAAPAAPRPTAPAPGAPLAPAAPVPAAKVAPQVPIIVPPEVASMPRSKRQAEARKKTDQATSALKAGHDDSAKAMIKEALGLLEGL